MNYKVSTALAQPDFSHRFPLCWNDTKPFRLYWGWLVAEYIDQDRTVKLPFATTESFSFKYNQQDATL